MYKYEINPVQATMKKFGGKLNQVQAINDTCFGICGAYSGTTDVYSMEPKCTQDCEELMEKVRYKNFGVGRCDHQTPHRPVLWSEASRFFPPLLKSGMSPKNTLKTCYKKCSELMPSSQECIDNCELDYNALVKPTTRPKPQHLKLNKGSPNKKHKKTWLWVLLGSLVFFILLCIAASIIVYKK